MTLTEDETETDKNELYGIMFILTDIDTVTLIGFKPILSVSVSVSVNAT